MRNLLSYSYECFSRVLMFGLTAQVQDDIRKMMELI